MTDMRLLEADDEGAEFRQAEPVRHLAAQHAALELAAADLALAGDHQHEGQAFAMGALQEAEQCMMGIDLGHAVQVEPCVDLALPTRQPRALAAAERRQRRDDRPRDWLGRLSGNDRPGCRNGLDRRRFGNRGNAVRLERPRLLSQRPGLPGHAVPQRALLLAQDALAVGRGWGGWYRGWTNTFHWPRLIGRDDSA